MYPSVITSFPLTSPTDRLNNPSHSGLENLQSSAIGQLQTFIGTNSSAIGTILYDVRSPESNGGGHIQTANKGGTGQTAYAKGDMLVATSSSVLAKLAVGTDGQGLRADSGTAAGVAWGSTNSIPVTRVYTNASIFAWSKPSFMSYARVIVQGAGGSGNGITTSGGGTGGTGGGYADVLIPASLLGAVERLQLGGSIVGTTGAGTTNYSGFGTFVSILGGVSSIYTANGLSIPGGAGGNGSQTADAPVVSLGGKGGDAFIGQGGSGGLTSGSPITGGSGSQYGGGGAGGATESGTDATGGNSAQGIIIVYEY